MTDHEVIPEGIYSHSHYHDTIYHSLANNGTRKGAFGIDWPDASLHPFFYVGIYGGIGIAIALANVLSATAQYTAALKASRVLFQYVILVLLVW